MALSSRERRCALRKIAEDAKITDPELQDRIIANIEADERWFLADLKGHGQATPSKLERDFKRIEREAIQLLKALGLDQYDDPEDGLPLGPIRNLLEFRLSDENGARGERELRRLVVAVGRLRDFARAERVAAEGNKRKGNKRKAAHHGDKALNNFIGQLLQIYREAGKKPGLSRHWKTKKPSGPTLRYVRACLELVKGDNPNLAHLIRNLSDKALASRIQRAKKPENPYRPK